MADPEAILAALQQSLDTVVTDKTIDRAAQNDRYLHEYQHVHWSTEASALSCVTLMPMPTGHRPSSAFLLAQVYYGRRQNVRPNAPLPEGFIDRLAIQCQTPDWELTEPLAYNSANDWHQAGMVVPIWALRSRTHLRFVLL
jgi:hypothetical protein